MIRVLMMILVCLMACNAAPSTGAPAPTIVYVPMPTELAATANGTPPALPPLQYAATPAPPPSGVLSIPHGVQPQDEPSRTLHKKAVKPCGLSSCALEDQCCAEGTLHVHGCYPQAYVCQRPVR